MGIQDSEYLFAVFRKGVCISLKILLHVYADGIGFFWNKIAVLVHDIACISFFCEQARDFIALPVHGVKIGKFFPRSKRKRLGDIGDENDPFLFSAGGHVHGAPQFVGYFVPICPKDFGWIIHDGFETRVPDKAGSRAYNRLSHPSYCKNF